MMLLVFVLAMVAAGCGGNEADVADGGDITVSYLTGTWAGVECNCSLVFEDDGTYRIVQGAGQGFAGVTYAEDTTVEQGDFSVEGTVVTFVSNAESQNCEAGDRLVSEIEILEGSALVEDTIRQVTIEDECAIRGTVRSVTMQRVS